MAVDAQRGLGSGAVTGVRRDARALVRALALVAGTGVLTCVWAAGWLATFAAPRARRAWRAWVFRRWARWCLACTGVRATVLGKPPREPGFLVSNHCGYIDICLLAAHVDCVFLSMAEIRRWPFLGRMSRAFGTVFVDRATKRDIPAVNRALLAAVERGETVVFFPEGTNSRGDRVYPFRPAHFEVAASSKIPVAYATIRYATSTDDPPASAAVCWVDTPIARHARAFLGLRSIDATLRFGSERVRGDDRKSLARELECRVAQPFEPMH